MNNSENNYYILLKIINNILNEKYKDIDVNIEQPLKEIGLHSLLTYKFISVIEKEFNISFEIEDLHIENFSTLDKVNTLLNKYQINEEDVSIEVINSSHT